MTTKITMAKDGSGWRANFIQDGIVVRQVWTPGTRTAAEREAKADAERMDRDGEVAS